MTSEESCGASGGKAGGSGAGGSAVTGEAPGGGGGGGASAWVAAPGGGGGGGGAGCANAIAAEVVKPIPNSPEMAILMRRGSPWSGDGRMRRDQGQGHAGKRRTGYPQPR